jgi:hypothetical protein
MRYVDITGVEEDQEGNPIEVVHKQNAMLPISVDEKNITSIQPYFNQNGTIFKNVSYINYDGEILKVVGNYKQISENIRNHSYTDRVKIKGFKR